MKLTYGFMIHAELLTCNMTLNAFECTSETPHVGLLERYSLKRNCSGRWDVGRGDDAKLVLNIL